MPSRKRSNLSAVSAGAKRLRLLRASESTEKRETRLRSQKARQSAARASETTDQRQTRLRYQRLRQSSIRAVENQTQRDKRLEADRVRHARLRDSETEGQRERRLAADRRRHARAKDAETPADGIRRRPTPASGRKRKRNRETDGSAAARRDERRAVVKENNNIRRVLKRWMHKMRKQLHIACSMPLESCESETYRVKMEPIQFDGDKPEANNGLALVGSASTGDVDPYDMQGTSHADGTSQNTEGFSQKVTVKTEDVFGDEAVSDALYTVEEGIVPKVEAGEEMANLTEVSDSALPDSVEKQVELFVYADKDSSLRTNGVPEESDPLRIDSKLVPSSLITISDGGVLREENYSTSWTGRKNTVILNKVKVEPSDGELETSRSPMADT